MGRKLNVACLQTRAFASEADALNHALVLAKQAVSAGAELLVLPEYSGGLKTEGRFFAPPVFDESKHPFLLGMQSFAREHAVWIVVGSVAVTPDEHCDESVRASHKFLNRTVVLNSSGVVVARYNKIHLFDIELSEKQSFKESEKVLAGNRACIVETPFAKIGLSICYDLRFAYLYRDLAKAGAEVLLVPAAFTKKTGQAHWHILNRARAIENGAFVLAACATSSIPGGGESFGHSLIVDPWGAVLADGGEDVGVVQHCIDLDDVASTRTKIPSLTHDKPYTLAVSGGVESTSESVA